MAQQSYYDLLGLNKDASEDDLKRAYRKKAVQYHPDKNPGNKDAEEMFKRVSQAYEVLKDPEKRAAYDRFGPAAFEAAQGGRSGPHGGSAGFNDPFDIFREVFGQNPGRSSIFEQIFNEGRSEGTEGADLRYDLEISLEDAARGVEREISYRRLVSCERCHGSGAEPGSKMGVCSECSGTGQIRRLGGIIMFTQTCPKCGGSGRRIERPCGGCKGNGRLPQNTRLNVKIPPGVDSGSRLRSAGNGECGIGRGSTGDLYIVISVKKHELFDRHGDDLHCTVPVKFTIAALGGSIEIPTLFGKASLQISSGTQSGTTLRLRERGMPSLRGGRRGDQLIRVEIDVPTSLDAEQRRTLESFAQLSGDRKEPLARTFFQKAKRFF